MPIHSDENDLRSQACDGSLRLEAVDAQRRGVGAPVAYVELGPPLAQRNGGDPATLVHADLVRAGFDAMTRTMEAMQRAQVERERALAQKEKALTDAQVAAQKSHMQFMIALVERAGGGTPQDPVTMLKQAFDVHNVLDQHGQRNARALPADSAIVTTTSKAANPIVEALKPAFSMGSSFLAEIAVEKFAKDDPMRAKAIRDGFANAVPLFTGAMGDAPTPQPIAGQSQPAAPDAGIRNSASTSPDEEGDGDDDDGDDRRVHPKIMREVLALLDDEEADRFEKYTDALDEEAYEQLVRAVHALSSLDERIAWARGLTRTPISDEEGSNDEDTPTRGVALPDVPSGIWSLVAQLPPEDSNYAAGVLGALDRATLDKLCDRLLMLPADKALAALRRIADEARRRSASIAQRAAASALSDENPEAVGGAS